MSDSAIAAAVLVAIFPISAYLIANKHAPRDDGYYWICFFVTGLSLAGSILLALVFGHHPPKVTAQQDPTPTWFETRLIEHLESNGQATLMDVLKDEAKTIQKLPRVNTEQLETRIIDVVNSKLEDLDLGDSDLSIRQQRICEDELKRWSEKYITSQRERIVKELLARCFPGQIKSVTPTPMTPNQITAENQQYLCDTLLRKWTDKSISKQRERVVKRLIETCLTPEGRKGHDHGG